MTGCSKVKLKRRPKLAILRLKKTATLSGLLGDWVRMRDVYAIYILFLVTVSLRYAWAAWRALRDGADADDDEAKA